MAGINTDYKAPAQGSYAEMFEQNKQNEINNFNAANQLAQDNYTMYLNDSWAQYQTSKSNYGQNAEKLASMGLQGSGYADYLNAQAYKYFRNDKQAASAQLGTAQRDNLIAHNNNMTELATGWQEMQNKAYENAMGMISEMGTFSDDYINQYIDLYALSAEQRMNLRNAQQNAYYSAYNGLLKGNMIEQSELDTAFNDGHLSQEKYNELTQTRQKKIDEWQKSNAATIEASIIDKDFETIVKDIYGDEGSLAQGKITQSQANQIMRNDMQKELNTLSDIKEIDAFVETVKRLPSNAADAKKELLSLAYNKAITLDEAARQTYNTSDAGVRYYLDRHSLSLGRDYVITYEDGETDTVYAKLYASSKINKELDTKYPSRKKGQIVKASDGSYYMCNGAGWADSWIMLSKFDTGYKIK